MLAGGKNPSASNYYCGNFHYRFRHAWSARELESLLPIMKEVDEEERPSVSWCPWNLFQILVNILFREYSLIKDDDLPHLKEYCAWHQIPNLVSH